MSAGELLAAGAAIIGVGGSIGGAWGAHMAMTATAVPVGVAASGGFVTVGSFAGGGLTASAVGGLLLGSVIGEYEPIRSVLTDFFEWGHTKPDGTLHIPGTPSQHIWTPPPSRVGSERDSTWEPDFTYSEPSRDDEPADVVGWGSADGNFILYSLA